MRRLYVGIDPGLDGAIARYYPDKNFVSVRDTPTVEVTVGDSKKRQPDISAMRNMLSAAVESDLDLIVVIERVWAMPSGPGKKATMGVTSAFNFGVGYGMWLGLIVGLGIPYATVNPNTWKRSMLFDGGKDKDASRVKVLQMFPAQHELFKLKKHHGRADALLLAVWGSKQDQQK